MSEQMTFVLPADSQSGTIQDRFEEFHRLNPWVYDRLVKLARELHGKGMKHLGINMLWEVLRWQYYQQTNDPNSRWHMNDHYPSRYARLIMTNETDLNGIFETRKLTA